jgi:spermidine synthase
VRLAAAGAVLAAILLAAFAPRWDPKLMTAGVQIYAAAMVVDGGAGMRAAQGRRELLLYEEGLSTTVAVSRSPTAVSLSVNGKTDASNGRDMATQLMLGHLGPLFLPAPRRALVIGLASGVTAGAVAQHPFERIDVAEIEPAMIRAARFFDAENLRVLDDPRVHVLDGDGRHLLGAAREPYDLVVSEPSNPWIAGVANLFTREFYEAARRQLAPGGVMVQWLLAYSIFGRDMQMVVRTFLEVFPHVTIWRGYPGDLLLLGSEGPLCLDPALVEARAARSPALGAQLERLGARADGLAVRFVLGDMDARRYAAGAPLNTDDLPLLEFSAPRALYVQGMEENVALVRSFRAVDRACVTGIDPAALTTPEQRLRFAEAALAEGLVEDVALELGRMGPSVRLAPDVRAARARLLLLAGRLEEAWQELTFLSVLRPGDPAVAAQLAAVEALADPAVARRLELSLRQLPGGVFADPGVVGELLIQLAGERGDPRYLPIAVELLERAVRLNPTRVPLMNLLAVALAQVERGSEAEVLLARAATIDPTDARTRYNRGAVLQRLGRIPEAADEFREAARLRPEWAEAQGRAAALGASSP